MPGTTQDLYQFQNVGRARIYGLETAAEAPLGHTVSGRWSVFGVASYTLGEDRTNEVPVSRIPPLGGNTGVRWETPGRGRWVEVFAEGAARQDRLAPTDESDTRIPTGGTPGWATLNVRAGAALRDDLRLSVALHNLTDTRYRVHGSGIDAPGLNMVAGLDWRF